MSDNPYRSPEFPGGSWSPSSTPQAVSAFVTAPAICLMVVAGISIAALAITIPFDLYLLASGAARELEREAIDPEISIVIRTIWGLVILAASCFVFWGALQMKGLRNYQTAWAAAIVATIPCVGPCCLLAIPFGVWSIIVLSKPEVKAAFTS